MATRAPTPAAARGAAVGLVTAAGAVWAHHASGGTVALLPGAVAVLASVAAGMLLGRVRPTSPWTALALTVATQGAWHVLFTTSASPHAAMAHGSGEVMLLTHVGAGLTSAALALGADRALVRLARAALDRWRVPLPGLPPYAVPRLAVAASVAGPPRPPAPGTAPVRGPPAGRTTPPPALAS
ncbi:hypothetical protein [uncultured Nocardioides sp.]|uniref:hypothetical protein n=1 Tax=uncultured Nocardioides sp. TaxID=198441 RepID=UPI0026154691|nr:hypothetical protein [uncultured Nocardioides sp.]